MPLPISHGLIGASIVAAIHPQPINRYFTPLFIGAFLANAADFDFFFVFLLQSKDWHRGFSHSILFAILICLICLLFLGKQHIRAAIAYGLAFTSHFLWDYITTKEGGGVELFWFFSIERFGLGWFGLSELPSRLPAIGIVKALAVEFVLFAPLLALIIYLRKYVGEDLISTKDSV